MINYVGFKDIFNRPIYEGDILINTPYGKRWENIKEVCVVVGTLNNLSLLVSKQTQTSGLHRISHGETIEKIGNIYNTPEINLLICK